MNVFVQLRREIAAFFFSPMAYVLLAAAMVVNGGVFVVIVDFLSDPRAGRGAAMQMLFGGTIFYYLLLLVVASLITMRLLAEERHSGTLETLLTAPISDAQVVLAKYLAAVAFYVVLWVPTLTYPLFLSRFSALDPGPITSGYLGTVLLGMMFLSVGLFFSAVTRNQIVAALLSFVTNFGLFLVGIFEFISPGTSSESVLGYMNLWTHMEDFGRGIVDTRHVVYLLSVTAFVLFCTVQVQQSRRWRA